MNVETQFISIVGVRRQPFLQMVYKILMMKEFKFSDFAKLSISESGMEEWGKKGVKFYGEQINKALSHKGPAARASLIFTEFSEYLKIYVDDLEPLLKNGRSIITYNLGIWTIFSHLVHGHPLSHTLHCSLKKLVGDVDGYRDPNFTYYLRFSPECLKEEMARAKKSLKDDLSLHEIMEVEREVAGLDMKAFKAPESSRIIEVDAYLSKDPSILAEHLYDDLLSKGVH